MPNSEEFDRFFQLHQVTEKQITQLFDRSDEASKERHNLRAELGQRLVMMELKQEQYDEKLDRMYSQQDSMNRKLDLLVKQFTRAGGFWGGILFLGMILGAFIGFAISFFKN